MKNWARGEEEKTVIQKTANYVNTSMASVQHGSCVEKNTKSAQWSILKY